MEFLDTLFIRLLTDSLSFAWLTKSAAEMVSIPCVLNEETILLSSCCFPHNSPWTFVTVRYLKKIIIIFQFLALGVVQ